MGLLGLTGFGVGAFSPPKKESQSKVPFLRALRGRRVMSESQVLGASIDSAAGALHGVLVVAERLSPDSVGDGIRADLTVLLRREVNPSDQGPTVQGLRLAGEVEDMAQLVPDDPILPGLAHEAASSRAGCGSAPTRGCCAE